MDLSNNSIWRFIWHALPGASTSQTNMNIQEYLNGQIPESFDERIMFMFVFNDIELTKKGISETCLHNPKEVAAVASHFKPGHWCFLGPASQNSCGMVIPTNLQENEILSHCKWFTRSSVILPTRYCQRQKERRKQLPFPRYIRQQEDSHEDHVDKQFTMYLHMNLPVV